MRVFLTGASGFVGSHLARVFAARGADVDAPSHAELDLTDRAATLRAVDAAAPDALVHAAILNDAAAMAADKARAWNAYVGATRNVVDAAAGTHVVLVSTDWVFDGAQGPAAESAPPNPVNQYGFLKAASELVVTERAERGSVARIAAVQGAAEGAPREQDAGFGYFVAALVERLRAGERFGVWESDRINKVATPTLASAAAELMWRVLERDLDGIFHCCGGESVDRRTLAMRAAQVFELDPTLLDLHVRPPDDAIPAPVPYDTSLDATRTAALLDAELPDVTEMLKRMSTELTPA